MTDTLKLKPAYRLGVWARHIPVNVRNETTATDLFTAADVGDAMTQARDAGYEGNPGYIMQWVAVPAMLTQRDMVQWFPGYRPDADIGLTFIRDERGYAVGMHGHYTVEELEQIVHELKLANTTFSPREGGG